MGEMVEIGGQCIDSKSDLFFVDLFFFVVVGVFGIDGGMGFGVFIFYVYFGKCVFFEDVECMGYVINFVDVGIFLDGGFQFVFGQLVYCIGNLIDWFFEGYDEIYICNDCNQDVGQCCGDGQCIGVFVFVGCGVFLGFCKGCEVVLDDVDLFCCGGVYLFVFYIEVYESCIIGFYLFECRWQGIYKICIEFFGFCRVLQCFQVFVDNLEFLNEMFVIFFCWGCDEVGEFDLDGVY